MRRGPLPATVSVLPLLKPTADFSSCCHFSARLPEHRRVSATQVLGEFCRRFNEAFPLVDRFLTQKRRRSRLKLRKLLSDTLDPKAFSSARQIPFCSRAKFTCRDPCHAAENPFVLGRRCFGLCACYGCSGRLIRRLSSLCPTWLHPARQRCVAQGLHWERV